LKRRHGLVASFVQAPPERVANIILAIYGKKPSDHLQSFDAHWCKELQSDSLTVAPEALLTSLLAYATYRRASDVHLVPHVNGVLMLFRVDGVLRPVLMLHNNAGRVVAAVKVAAGMDIGDTLRPQGGRFQRVVNDQEIDVRVSSAVSTYGENIVLRLLPKGGLFESLEKLGFLPQHMGILKRMFEAPYGLSLFTGPTGSGKTTSLFSGLRQHTMAGKSIVTIEDPVEYDLVSACQTQVNRKAGYTFDIAIKHFLRHDPDIMLVGEIRDGETAEAALQAAETGHLVLSTLHVNSPFSVPIRLESLGVSRHVLSEALVGMCTQRLVRKLCANCKVDSGRVVLSGSGPAVTVHAPGGCSVCDGTGYQGRLPVYETIIVDADVSAWLATSSRRSDFTEIASASNYIDIDSVVTHRLVKGETSLEEVQRVLGHTPKIRPA
jgi:general secretion pathway protein E